MSDAKFDEYKKADDAAVGEPPESTSANEGGLPF
jgi:hypothetical protein